jgi:hypothetical protein
MPLFSHDIISFYASLQPHPRLPAKIEWLYPQQDPAVRELSAAFFNKYFSDTNKRHLLFGINPGRFGAGVTGVNFTAPRQLAQYCGIAHTLKDQSELSAEFIYKVIEAYGGPAAFYSRFFISSVCPLGFVKNGININYYDDPRLLKKVSPFIVDCINRQLQWNVHRKSTICIGGEKNFKALQAFNAKHQWFETILPLPHPRFIMQYRRRFVADYVGMYLEALEKLE